MCCQWCAVLFLMLLCWGDRLGQSYWQTEPNQSDMQIQQLVVAPHPFLLYCLQGATLPRCTHKNIPQSGRKFYFVNSSPLEKKDIFCLSLIPVSESWLTWFKAPQTSLNIGATFCFVRIWPNISVISVRLYPSFGLSNVPKTPFQHKPAPWYVTPPVMLTRCNLARQVHNLSHTHSTCPPRPAVQPDRSGASGNRALSDHSNWS